MEKYPMHFYARNGIKNWENMSTFSDSDNNFTRIHYAATIGEVDFLSDYLKHSTCDINAKTSDGDTPLLLAAKNWRERAVQLLIESGADINCTDGENWTILHYACLRDWLEIVQFFAENKHFNIDAKTNRGKTALMIAVEERNKDIAEVLLKCGADVTCCDKDQWNTLHYASHFALYGVVQYVLQKKLCLVNDKTSSGDTPLLLAAKSKCRRIVKLLIQCKADIKCRDSENFNLLHYAAQNLWAEVVRLTVNSKIFDLNDQTFNGETALYFACEDYWYCSGYGQTRLEIIDMLLSAGVDCNLKVNSGNRALNLLLEECHKEQASTCIQLLIKHGAYFTSSDYERLYVRQLLKEHTILKDQKLGTQIVINNFNHVHLPAFYQIPGFLKHLPNIKSLQINSEKSVAGDIERCVKSEIKTKQFCNVMEVRPMVLQMMCVRSLIGYHSNFKRSASSCGNDSSVKKQRLISHCTQDKNDVTKEIGSVH